MTLVPQLDGAIQYSPRANSFVTVAEFQSFYADRNDEVVADADVAALEEALIWGSDYLTQKFRLRWVGSLTEAFQPLTWPRRGAPVPDFFDPFHRDTNVPFAFRTTVFIAENEIPQEVKTAQMYLARSSLLSGTEAESLETTFGRVTRREKLGDLEVEYFGAMGGGQRQETLYWDAQKIVEPYLRPVTRGTALRS